MRFWPKFAVLTFSLMMLLGNTPTFGDSKNVSCECEKITCGACQKEVNSEFYTSKCAGNRVKSCEKPLCAALDPEVDMIPKECAPKNSVTQNTETTPSQKTEKSVDKQTVGTVLMSVGEVKVTRNEVANPLRIGNKIFNEDMISTGENGKVKVMFTDESHLTLLPKAKTKVNHETSPAKNRPSSTVVNLFFGTVRSVVTKSENGQKKYRVDTPSATAGVRGTDFLTSYYEANQSTKVQTLEGSVELTSLSGGTKTLVPAGHFASYVVDTDRNTPSPSMKYVDNGFITPLGAISEDNKKEIAKKFDFDSSRDMASSTGGSDPICQAPSAFFNQCSYQCVNNPKGAGSCRTDLEKVKCIRKRCNANGVWAEETRLPSSNFEKCPSNDKALVDRCDY